MATVTKSSTIFSTSGATLFGSGSSGISTQFTTSTNQYAIANVMADAAGSFFRLATAGDFPLQANILYTFYVGQSQTAAINSPGGVNIRTSYVTFAIS